jgi:hypothetical protein
MGTIIGLLMVIYKTYRQNRGNATINDHSFFNRDNSILLSDMATSEDDDDEVAVMIEAAAAAVHVIQGTDGVVKEPNPQPLGNAHNAQASDAATATSSKLAKTPEKTPSKIPQATRKTPTPTRTGPTTRAGGKVINQPLLNPDK